MIASLCIFEHREIAIFNLTDLFIFFSTNRDQSVKIKD